MHSCPDCREVEEQIKGKSGYEIIDIGSHVRLLKEFLQMRDNDPAFAGVRRRGTVGIPCFVLEDGRVTLRPDEAGLERRPRAAAGFSGQSPEPAPDFAEGSACSLDGKGC